MYIMDRCRVHQNSVCIYVCILKINRHLQDIFATCIYCIYYCNIIRLCPCAGLAVHCKSLFMQWNFFLKSKNWELKPENDWRNKLCFVVLLSSLLICWADISSDSFTLIVQVTVCFLLKPTFFSVTVKEEIISCFFVQLKHKRGSFWISFRM